MSLARVFQGEGGYCQFALLSLGFFLHLTLECVASAMAAPLLWLLLLLGQFAQRIKFKFLDCLVEWQPKVADIRATLSSLQIPLRFAHNNNLNDVLGIGD